MVGHICRRGSRRKLELDGGHYRAGGFLGGCVLRFCRLVFGVLFFGVLLASGASAGPLDEAAALNAQVGELYHAGKYSQAIEITKKVLAILEPVRNFLESKESVVILSARARCSRGRRCGHLKTGGSTRVRGAIRVT